jgi:xylulokinase
MSLERLLAPRRREASGQDAKDGSVALIGVDVGTSATKGLVISDDGAEIGRARENYSVIFPADGRAEINPRTVWAAVKEVLTALASTARSHGDVVRGLALSVSGNEASPVDAAGQPLYPTVMGTDSRSADVAQWWERTVGRRRTYEITGIPVHPMHPLMRLIWLREHEADVYRRIDKMLCWEELFVSWMGAGQVTDVSIASCTMAFDIGRRCWSAEMLESAGVDPAMFPAAVRPGTAIGEMSPALAAELGFARPPVVVAGGFDQPMAALGAGQTAPGEAGVSTGTWEALLVVTQEPRLTEEMLAAGYPFGCYVTGDLYYTAANNPGGGSVLQWFRDTLGEADLRIAERSGRDAFDVIVGQATASPTSLLLLPHFAGSYNPWMNPWSAGALFGLTLRTTKADIIKGLLEGITYELRENLQRLEAAGITVGDLVATGGGARSPTWLQLKADMTGKAVKTVNVAEPGCFAAACLAGVGVGQFSSVTEPISDLIKVRRVFEPRPAHRDFYEAAASRYRALYQQLAPLSGPAR